MSVRIGEHLRANALAALVLGGVSGCSGSGPASDTPSDTPTVTDAGTVTDADTDTDTDTQTDTDTDTDSATTPSDPCGPCPTGTSCGSANGIPVCRDDATGTPRFEHVFVVLMENTDYDELVASTNTPYLHGLVAAWAYATDYHGIEHPSLPNYIELVSGSVVDNGPFECDCDPAGGACNAFTCNTLAHGCGCPQTQEHLGDQLESAGVSWRAYAEDMGAACNLESSGDYAARHVPFLYFPSLTDDAPRCADHVVDYGAFAADVASPRGFTFIAPNLINDMHDPFPAGPQNLANGDAWLAAQMPAILSSPGFTDRGLLVIVWDEDESDLSLSDTSDHPIPMILMSPLAKQGGYASGGRVDHDNLLALFEDGLGVPRLAGAQGVDPLSDYFPAQ